MARCPTPWKPAHPNPQAAFRAAQAAPWGGMKHYQCPCGAWHVTTDETLRAKNPARGSKADYGRKRWHPRRLKKPKG